ncbi:MAG: SIMPL domain-containing protein [Lachnospiraceae bacterium]|nr:SIMPL domain-containing protein [Lachnospiraceae bacterium]
MRTIKVTGTGTVKLKPDIMRLRLDLNGKEKEYAKTLKRSSDDTEVLRGLFADLGFAKEDLKTLSFSADPVYEGYEDKQGRWRQRFVGYEYHHRLKLDFPFDNDRLGKILTRLAKAKVDPEFSIGYTVKDPEAAKNQLLAAAVKDAAEKAEILAAAAGVKLLGIQTMDYSIARVEMEVMPARKLMATNDMAMGAMEESMDLDIQPEDITASDTVTITWELG